MKPYYEHAGITIYHGDCREILPQLKADVMVIDPPYGMNFTSSRGGHFGSSKIAGDSNVSLRDEVLEIWDWKPALVFGRWSIPRPIGTKMILVWDKGEHVGMGDLSIPWKPNTEEIYVIGNGFIGYRDGSVLRHHAIAGTVGRADMGTRSHPTEKPVSLMKALLRKCAGIILDPFMGSGATLAAAKDLGREAVGIELEERYCEIAAKRLSQEVFEFNEVAGVTA